MAQASSLSSRAEGASAVEVPAKDAGVHHLNGTNTVELKDQTSPTKVASTTNDQLPPLLSMIIDGLPPFKISKYVNEAEKRLQEYAERHPNVVSLGSYCRIGLSLGAYAHPEVISVDRLVVISLHYGLQFLVDDLLFDSPDEFLQDQCGVSRSACESTEKNQEYLDHLDELLHQLVQPSNPAPLLETLMWELGRDTLELSNPEWFGRYVACIRECHRAGVDSQADIVRDNDLWFRDVESYAAMRVGNGGGRFIQMLMEFASDTYIPGELRATPYLKNLATTTSIHLAFANDLFSYHKESVLEQNPRNLITVLMKREGKPFPQTVDTAIDLTNAYARAILDLEAEAWNSALQTHLQDIKAVIAGNIYFSMMDYRYRHPDSAFPEMRDMTRSWKIPPYVDV